MTIEQTVEIPELTAGNPVVIQLLQDRKPFIEFPFPKKLPAGKFKIELTVTPAAEPSTNPYEAMEQAAGFAKKLGSTLTVDRFLEMKRMDKAMEDEQNARRFRESLDRMCLNRSTFTDSPSKNLEPLMGIARGSSFTVECLLEERRKEG